MGVCCLLCDRVCGIVVTSSACFHTNSCLKPMLAWKNCTAAARSRRIRHDFSERGNARYVLWRHDEKREHYKTKQSERAHMKTTVENLTTIPRSFIPSRIHSQHHARTSQRKIHTFGARSISTPSKSYGQASWHRLKWWSQHHFKHIIIATRSERDSFQTCEISVARTGLPINNCKGVLFQACSLHSNISRLAFDASWGIRLKRQCSPRFLFPQRQIIIPRRQDWCLCTVCGNAHSCVVG